MGDVAAPTTVAAFAGVGDVMMTHQVLCPARNPFLAPSLEAETCPTGPSSMASPRKACEVDRRGLVIALPAVEGIRTDAVRNEAVAAAGRSDFPGARSGLFSESVTPFDGVRFSLRPRRAEPPGPFGCREPNDQPPPPPHSLQHPYEHLQPHAMQWQAPACLPRLLPPLKPFIRACQETSPCW